MVDSIKRGLRREFLDELKKSPPIISGILYAFAFAATNYLLRLAFGEHPRPKAFYEFFFIGMYISWFGKWALFRALGRRIQAKDALVLEA